MNSFIALVLALCFIGFVLWAVKSAPFIDASFKPVITWVVIVLVAIWLFSVFFGGGSVNLPRFHVN